MTVPAPYPRFCTRVPACTEAQRACACARTRSLRYGTSGSGSTTSPYPLHGSGYDPHEWAQRPGWVARELRTLVPDGLPGAGQKARQDLRWLNRARAALIQRDGPTCRTCGCEDKDDIERWLRDPEWGFPFEVDHVVALCDDGEHSLANMQLLCTPCHDSKSGEDARARPNKAEKMAMLEARGWQRLSGKHHAARKQTWRSPEGKLHYLDRAWRMEGIR